MFQEKKSLCMYLSLCLVVPQRQLQGEQRQRRCRLWEPISWYRFKKPWVEFIYRFPQGQMQFLINLLLVTKIPRAWTKCTHPILLIASKPSVNIFAYSLEWSSEAIHSWWKILWQILAFVYRERGGNCFRRVGYMWCDWLFIS